MGLGVQVVVMPEHAEDQTGRLVDSSVIFDGTLIHQSVVVTLNGVFHDGSEGCGLIGALAKLLNGRHQFHRLLTEADAELLRSVGMVVCHCWWGV